MAILRRQTRAKDNGPTRCARARARPGPHRRSLTGRCTLRIVILALVLAATLPTIIILTVTYMLTRRVQTAVETAKEVALAEVQALCEGKPCQLATILTSAGQIIGSQAGRSAKASFMSDMSHSSRDATLSADQQDVGDISASNPAIGAALSGLKPRQLRGLLGNPLVQMALPGILRSLGGNQVVQSAGNGKPPKSFAL